MQKGLAELRMYNKSCVRLNNDQSLQLTHTDTDTDTHTHTHTDTDTDTDTDTHTHTIPGSGGCSI